MLIPVPTSSDANVYTGVPVRVTSSPDSMRDSAAVPVAVAAVDLL